MGLTNSYSEAEARVKAITLAISRLEDVDGCYRIDKKIIQTVMGYIADIIEETDNASKYLRGLTQQGLNMSDATICIDAANICAKECRTKLINATNDQLPF